MFSNFLESEQESITLSKLILNIFYFEPVFYGESFIFMSKIWHIFLFCLFFLIFVNRKWDLFVLIVLTQY